MDKRILQEFVEPSFLNGEQFHSTEEGFLMVRYADDFLILSKTIKDLEELATSRIYKFLKPQGLTLSTRKPKSLTSLKVLITLDSILGNTQIKHE